jgi:hypothetical protein
MDIPVLNGEIVLPPKRKAISVKGGRERGKGWRAATSGELRERAAADEQERE